MSEGIVPLPVQNSQENIKDGNSADGFNKADFVWFMWRVFGVILMTPIVFFALIFFPDQCFAGCRISFYYIDRPETWPGAFLWFTASLSLSIYFFFYRKKKSTRI